jgi:acyl-coenzyme A synthetase/AMP-(fatty) acid ligase/acyl carrier protein
VPTVIIPEEVVKDPVLLVENMAAAHVSRIVLVPSLLRVLLDSFGDLQKRLVDLKIWVSSGEEIPVELAQRFRQVMPEAKLINLYGSSEVSADVTFYEVADGMLDRCIPIGRPIDNTSIYILDSHLQPVPIGVPGELYIGGVGLARGYLNQPDLTAERFIPSPFGQEEVLFKTGDLGRYLLEGNIEYLGRRDHQVKVRGFRIELGEIESQIKRLRAVSNCVVVLREDRSADQRLTAYYVCKDGHVVSESEVRRQLQAQLPGYMLPQHFMELSSIPLTPNGKVDRQALPKPEVDGASDQGYVAPRTEVEQKIAAVWQEVLNSERVGVNDDFFNLGGHSLLATQVMSRINKLFNIQLPLRRLFEAKTIEGLAEVIDISLWNSQGLQKSGIAGTEGREVIEF